VTLKIGAVVLAAGFSNRFGSIKICANLASGQTVLRQTLTNIQPAVSELLVVTRPDVYPLIADSAADIQVFEDAEKGMGATLAHAIRLVQARGDWDGCLVCLADMPFIRPETYQILVQALRPENIVVPFFAGRPGNPTGFGSHFYEQLTGLTGDRGGRLVVRQNPQAATRLEVDDPAILLDIDTPDDLQRFDRGASLL
jgi:molybdenum cofactor cytidylyltransferase